MLCKAVASPAIYGRACAAKGLSREAWRMIASIVRTYISALERGVYSAIIDIGC